MQLHLSAYAVYISLVAMLIEVQQTETESASDSLLSCQDSISWMYQTEIRPEVQDAVSWRTQMELKAELPHLQGVCLEVVSRKGIMERQPKLSKLQGVCQDHNLLCESHQLELAASEHPKFQDAVLWKAQMEMKPKLATLKGLHEDVVLLKGVDCKPKATSLYVAGQDVNCWKRRGKRRLEGSSLPTSYKEPTCQETYAATSTPEAHVLAVDDSNIDRKIIEGLLKTSLYKGALIYLSCFLFDLCTWTYSTVVIQY